MIPTQGKMTPSATLLMKAPFIRTGHTSAVTNLLSCSGSGGWSGQGGVRRGEVREPPPPRWAPPPPPSPPSQANLNLTLVLTQAVKK